MKSQLWESFEEARKEHRRKFRRAKIMLLCGAVVSFFLVVGGCTGVVVCGYAWWKSSQLPLPKILVEGKNSLHYDRTITEEEAQGMVAYFISNKDFDSGKDSGIVVKAAREGGVVKVKISAKKGLENDLRVTSLGIRMGEGLQKKVFPNAYVDVLICDERWNVVRVAR